MGARIEALKFPRVIFLRKHPFWAPESIDSGKSVDPESKLWILLNVLNSALAEHRQWLMKLLQHRLMVSVKVPTDMGIFMKYSYMVLQM